MNVIFNSINFNDWAIEVATNSANVCVKFRFIHRIDPRFAFLSTKDMEMSLQFMPAFSGLSNWFALPRPHGLGYEILAFQAILKWLWMLKSLVILRSHLYFVIAFWILENLTLKFLLVILRRNLVYFKLKFNF